MTPQELKNSILKRAIEGKLVEQRKEEGTGAELFEKIQKEKKKLVEEGKIKKQKSLPKITEDEIPFDIPKTWKWVRLGDVGEWAAGSTPLRTNLEFYGGEIPWLKTGDLNDGFITEVPEYITDLALSRTSLKLNPVGSVLIAMYGATIGKLGILKKPMTTNQACCACQPLDGIYNLYLFYFLMSSRRRLIKMAEGGAQPNISRTKIIGLSMPLPPLAEQKRIVEKIEELMPLVDKYEKNWQKLEELNKKFPEYMKKSLLQEAIKGKLVEQRPEEGNASNIIKELLNEKQKLSEEGKLYKKKPTAPFFDGDYPFDIPETWSWVQLSDVSIIQEGAGIRKYQYKVDGIQLLCVTNILENNIDLSKKQLFVSEEEYFEKYQHLTPLKGDILTACSGGSWGKVAIYNLDDTIMLNTSTLRLRFFGDLSNNKYLYYVTQSAFFKEQLKRQSVGIQPNFGYAHYSRIEFPLPPLAEQKRIVEKLDEMLPYCDELLKMI